MYKIWLLIVRYFILYGTIISYIIHLTMVNDFEVHVYVIRHNVLTISSIISICSHTAVRSERFDFDILFEFRTQVA